MVHNQMIQNKRSQLVRDINICCGAYGWCRHMLWSICLVCQVEQADTRGKTPTNISTSKKAVHLPFFLMKCANEGRFRFLQHLPWSICFDRLWLDGGKTFYANYLLHSASITQMVLQKTTNGGKFVTSCLAVT